MIFYCTDSPLFLENGRYYTLGLASIVERYYKAFGRFVILARVFPTRPGQPYVDVTEFFEEVIPMSSLAETLPYASSRLRKQVHEVVSRTQMSVVRMPAFSGIGVARECQRQGKPLFVELCGCPWDGLWNHGISGKLVAPYMFFKTREMVAHAQYVHYATDEFLQKRYPCTCANVSVSNVKINNVSNEVLQKRLAKIERMDKKEIRLMTSAAVNVRYKGQQYVIAAMALLKKKGIRATYRLAGGGDTSFLRSIARRYGVEEQVVFLGRLSHEAIFEELDQCDIYVQPSLQEGLPRAMIEAMSRACPCVGARTGGIPELLPPGCVVKRKSPQAIADTVLRMLDSGMEQYARNSWLRAKDFEPQLLMEKINSFYAQIKKNFD